MARLKKKCQVCIWNVMDEPFLVPSSSKFSGKMNTSTRKEFVFQYSNRDPREFLGSKRGSGVLQDSPKPGRFPFSSHSQRCLNCAPHPALESAPGRFIPSWQKKRSKRSVEKHSQENIWQPWKAQLSSHSKASRPVLAQGSFPEEKNVE